jgi:cytochrome d ubiquinol oxidase subunit II
VPWQFTIWTGAADISSLRFVAAGIVVILPIIVGYPGHAYRVFRGRAGGDGYAGNATPGPPT